jgi:hypothetical protein
MKACRINCCLILLFLFIGSAYGQRDNKTMAEQCGTMQRLDMLFQRNPNLKSQFEQERNRFNDALRSGNLNKIAQSAATGNKITYSVPVVFHIVLTNPNLVTDAQIQSQLDVLNNGFAGQNADSSQIPAYFKPFFGAAGIQFCLAKQSPSGDPSNGIDRVTTSVASFSNTDNDAVKHTSTGGADAWDPSGYFNVWICQFSGGLLGYATFPGPGDGSDLLQGVAIEYRSLPGAAYPSFTTYNSGKTLVHETGHYFNLYHIWGDDGGACTGTDYVDDTPNQGGPSSGCYSGIKLDACATTGNGIMYQNYMDYSNDDCMHMFTLLQVARMESALLTYRPSLLNSIGCQSPVQYNLDAQLKYINQPNARICNSSFTPSVTIRNNGTQNLTSINVNTVIDNGNAVVYTWTGNLAQFNNANVTLAGINTITGNHTITVYLSNANNATDANTKNDTLRLDFQYTAPVSTIAEGFEGSLFTPTGWDIVNPDYSTTWKKVLGAYKTGNASVMIDNFDYTSLGQQDYLRLPETSIPSTVDSAFFSFQLAAAVYTPLSTSNNNWDTLEVLISTDCGQTYTSLYKKYASTLVTHKDTVNTYFIPSAPSDWRKDSIYLSSYIGVGKFMLAFRNSTGNENNIYLDDINLRTVTINPNLKQRGILVTPNPSSGKITVQFYPTPSSLRSIQIFNLTGQKIMEQQVSGQGSNLYNFDISRNAAGTYIVRILMGNDVITQKIIKY